MRKVIDIYSNEEPPEVLPDAELAHTDHDHADLISTYQLAVDLDRRDQLRGLTAYRDF